MYVQRTDVQAQQDVEAVRQPGPVLRVYLYQRGVPVLHPHL